MVKCSFLMITARENFPYLGRSDLHVFEPTLHCFKQQTFMDFEWVIVDALYEQRKDYFEDMKLPFTVKHVPAQPNVWLENGLPGICTQYNKGIIHADGELIFFTGDSHMFFPDFMEKLWNRYQEGYFPMAWYFYDNTFSRALPMEISPWEFDGNKKEIFDLAYPEQDRKSPISYNILGYEGKNVTIEHRYFEAFEDKACELHFASWGWWFGCSSAALEAMLKINGFNQRFDGDCMLLDCDVGSRLELAGYSARLALFRDIFLVRAPTQVGKWNDTVQKNRVTIKCNYPLIWISRYFNRYKANCQKIEEYEISWMKNVYCKEKCNLREFCKKNHPWQYPFEHKRGPKHPSDSMSDKKWFNFWKEHQELIDLENERKLRLSGEKYTEGTFV